MLVDAAPALAPTVALEQRSEAAVLSRPPTRPDTRVSSDTQPSEATYPFLLHAYTSQVALGALAAVVHPSVALGVEIPRATWGRLNYFLTWRVAYEHNTGFQQRVGLGVLPALRFDPHPVVGVQLGAEVGGVYMRSLWTPYQFDSDERTWSRGESDVQLTWQFGAEATLWFNVAATLGLGVFYGITILYPLAPENDVPALPLTKLGLCGRWVYAD